MSLDLSGDWALVDDPVTLSYRVKTDEGQYATAVTITYCQRSGLEKSDVETAPALLQLNGAVFHLWRAKCPNDFTPGIGDKLQQANHTTEVFIVVKVAFLDRDATDYQRYRLTVQQSAGGNGL